MTRDVWDRAAATFDDEADHGLGDHRTRAAWRALLLEVLPAPPARVIDIGCGTGTLTRLLLDSGYRVDGLDFSTEMIRRARTKCPEAGLVVADACCPSVTSDAYDVVLSRHVLWALDDPQKALAAWIALLKPPGTVVLIEGRWSTGAGLAAEEATRVVRSARREAELRPLQDAVYWGKDITDERYLLVSRQ